MASVSAGQPFVATTAAPDWSASEVKPALADRLTEAVCQKQS
jgi:hypothetical protein